MTSRTTLMNRRTARGGNLHIRVLRNIFLLNIICLCPYIEVSAMGILENSRNVNVNRPLGSKNNLVCDVDNTGDVADSMINNLNCVEFLDTNVLVEFTRRCIDELSFRSSNNTLKCTNYTLHYPNFGTLPFDEDVRTEPTTKPTMKSTMEGNDSIVYSTKSPEPSTQDPFHKRVEELNITSAPFDSYEVFTDMDYPITQTSDPAENEYPIDNEHPTSDVGFQDSLMQFKSELQHCLNKTTLFRSSFFNEETLARILDKTMDVVIHEFYNSTTEYRANVTKALFVNCVDSLANMQGMQDVGSTGDQNNFDSFVESTAWQELSIMFPHTLRVDDVVVSAVPTELLTATQSYVLHALSNKLDNTTYRSMYETLKILIWHDVHTVINSRNICTSSMSQGSISFLCTETPADSDIGAWIRNLPKLSIVSKMNSRLKNLILEMVTKVLLEDISV